MKKETMVLFALWWKMEFGVCQKFCHHHFFVFVILFALKHAKFFLRFYIYFPPKFAKHNLLCTIVTFLSLRCPFFVALLAVARSLVLWVNFGTAWLKLKLALLLQSLVRIVAIIYSGLHWSQWHWEPNNLSMQIDVASRFERRTNSGKSYCCVGFVKVTRAIDRCQETKDFLAW